MSHYFNISVSASKIKADPNGHSHGPENNFKSNGEEKEDMEGMETMMKPFMGFSKLFRSRYLDIIRCDLISHFKICQDFLFRIRYL